MTVSNQTASNRNRIHYKGDTDWRFYLSDLFYNWMANFTPERDAPSKRVVSAGTHSEIGFRRIDNILCHKPNYKLLFVSISELRKKLNDVFKKYTVYVYRIEKNTN
jgi:hypothetical protein